jgi:hypothetical protein
VVARGRILLADPAGDFAADDFRRVLEIVSTISIAKDADLPRRVVSLLWYIPIFMQWQVGRVNENGGDASVYAKAIVAVTNEIERLLGTP